MLPPPPRLAGPRGLRRRRATMSAAKENPCGKFQANIFNKSKCQNCFKPRESHLLNDEDLTQVLKEITLKSLDDH
nr:myosin phosphatase Rho-interacting protein-like [Equus asinus]